VIFEGWLDYAKKSISGDRGKSSQNRGVGERGVKPLSIKREPSVTLQILLMRPAFFCHKPWGRSPNEEGTTPSSAEAFRKSNL